MPPTSTEADVSLGEVNRNVNRLFDKVEELNKTVSDYPKWQDIRRIEDALAQRIDALEGWKTWTIRCILGALIVGAITALFLVKP